MTKRTRTHLDGSRCLEGTRALPTGFDACCYVFDGHVETCALDVRYEWWPEQRLWVIVAPTSERSVGVAMSFCPHCGKRLKPPTAPQPKRWPAGGQPGRYLRLRQVK